MSAKFIFSLIKNAFFGWKNDNASMWSAALSYYSVFSLAPLLLIVLSIAGLFFGKAAIEGKVYDQINGLIGSNGAALVQSMLSHASKPSTNIIGSLIGLILLLLGASGVFGQLKQALNTVWQVNPKAKRGGIIGLVQDRLINFSMVLTIGFLLIVSLIASAAINVIGSFFGGLLPFSALVLEIINIAISIIILSLLFALMLKFLPDTQVSWYVALRGGVVTALLFTLGKTLIGVYLGHSSVGSSYGAASSLAVLFVWVYYAAQIFLYGAEFTKVYAIERSEIPALAKRKKSAAKMQQHKKTATALMLSYLAFNFFKRKKSK